jgi:hypothetical protein
MKREFSPVYTALILVMVCALFRVLKSHYPEFIPNITPLMAIAYVGAMYLPARWGWLVGPATLVLTDIAFTRLNLQAGMPMFSAWTLISVVVYAAAGGIGILLARHKSLPKIISGSLGLSLLFYVIANTYAWAGGAVSATTPGYPQTFAGWIQANTTGLTGWEPTWHFLRNGMAGDLFFVFVLLLILDRGLIFGQAPAKTAPRLA